MVSVILRQCGVRQSLFIFLALTVLFLVCVVAFSKAAQAQDSTFTSWKVVEEKTDYSRYELPLDGRLYDGIEVRWYATSKGSKVSDDYVEFRLYNASGQLVGFYRYGRKGDNRDSITGWHAAYLVLPQRAAVSKLVLTLYQPGGSPRLVPSLSWAKPWEAGVDIQWHPLFNDGERFLVRTRSFASG